jgi:hypothetical protein
MGAPSSGDIHYGRGADQDMDRFKLHMTDALGELCYHSTAWVPWLHSYI